MEIAEKINSIVVSCLERNGAELVDMTFKREGGEMVLRVLADQPAGITMDECVHINHQLSEEFDGAGVIPEHYVLEVASPGLDRKFKTRKDYERALGKDVRIGTYGPVHGKREFIGKLTGINDSSVAVELPGPVSYEIPMEQIASAKLHLQF